MSASGKRMAIIPAGSLLTVSTGEYSDYSVRGVFRAKSDIDADALRQEWLKDNPVNEENYWFFNEDQFLGWVCRLGLLDPVDCFEWHIAPPNEAWHTMTVEQLKNRAEDEEE